MKLHFGDTLGDQVLDKVEKGISFKGKLIPLGKLFRSHLATSGLSLFKSTIL